MEKRTKDGFLLISDIRRRDESSENPTNEDVYADMQLQSDICREMKPLAAHLKCRLAYLNDADSPDIHMQIPNGVIYLQTWCPHQSSETRLIIEPPYNDSNMMTLSSRWYESALYYHNVIGRYTRYQVTTLAPLDLFIDTIYDECFDCTFERYTIWQYLTMITPLLSSYNSFASIYELFTTVIGREDDRLLRGNNK